MSAATASSTAAMSASTSPASASPRVCKEQKEQLVRVEAADSIGRAYADPAGALVPGLGAARRALQSTVWRDAYMPRDGSPPVLESYSLALPHLSRASRADVQRYFDNTWALTDALFCSLVRRGATPAAAGLALHRRGAAWRTQAL